MVWIPDDVWYAQKKGGKGGQATKKAPLTKKTPAKSQSIMKPMPKKTPAKSQGIMMPMEMVMQMMNYPGQKGALKKLSLAAAATPGTGVGQAKMFLAQWVQTKTGEQTTKDQIVYTTTQVEDSKPPEFVSEVILVPIDPSKSYKGKKSPNKKAAEAAAAEAALRQNGQGAVLKSGSLPAQPKKAKGTDPKVMEKLRSIDVSCKVWVGGLSEKTTQKALTKHFADSGMRPKIVDMMKKGKAVVAYDAAEDAGAAIAALNGTELDGKTLEVDVWVKPEKK